MSLFLLKSDVPGYENPVRTALVIGFFLGASCSLATVLVVTWIVLRVAT